jgi:hypothetical protein
MVPAGATPASSDQEDAVLGHGLEPHAHRRPARAKIEHVISPSWGEAEAV